MSLARRFDELVRRIQGLDGFGDFLRPLRWGELRGAAVGGPVVTVNVSRWRSDALLITEEGARVVELGELTPDGLSEVVREYLAAVERSQAASAVAWEAQKHAVAKKSAAAHRAYLKAVREAFATRKMMEGTLTATLEWLWETVAEPVLTGAGLTETPGSDGEWPRLWWSPTGLLTLLPLHAAGRHHAPGAAVMDRVVSSYTPTLRALLESRRSRRDEMPPDGMLLVALPETRGQMPLPQVEREQEILKKLFGGRRLTVLEGPNATLSAVRDALVGHRWVHFSCHGHQDPVRPSTGGVLLHDGILTINEIGAARIHREFVFLSACKTATGGVVLADEAVTLAAALHYTGYRHVIATLWSVYDDVAATVVDSVYADLHTDGRFHPDGAAVALHRATRLLRDEAPDRPSRWMPFTHTGP